jgi:signal transduction histidine kinase
MSPTALVVVSLTLLVVVVAGLLLFAIRRLFAAARVPPRDRGSSGEATMTLAIETAFAQLRAKQEATAARAEASERLAREIIASLTSGLLVVGLDRTIRIMNPAARRLLSMPEGDASGDYREAIQEPALSEIIDECLASGSAIVRRTIHLPEGRHPASRFGVTVSPVFDGEQRLHGAVCLFSDLTAVQQLEEQLRLKESLAAVGELTAGIAHEFRNGLATIHGYGKLIDPAQLPPAYRPYIEGIRAEAVALGEIVTNFLNFARPAQLTLADVDLRAVCVRAVEDIRAEARSLGGDAALGGEFGTMQGDEVLLRQAFSNLLRNAVQACAAAAATPAITVTSTIGPSRTSCTITVDDNGPGIPSSDRTRVFQPFFTSRRNGTGLGLALVQKIIVSHNGRVSVGTAPAGGARLEVVLPII